MGLFTERETLTDNKKENWWLRLLLVLFALIALGSASVMNREVITERQILIDSLSYFKLQNDSLKEENEFKDNQIGLRDMIIEEIKIENPKMINEILKNTEGLAYEK
jgi:hypothetical protein